MWLTSGLALHEEISARGRCSLNFEVAEFVWLSELVDFFISSELPVKSKTGSWNLKNYLKSTILLCFWIWFYVSSLIYQVDKSRYLTQYSYFHHRTSRKIVQIHIFDSDFGFFRCHLYSYQFVCFVWILYAILCKGSGHLIYWNFTLESFWTIFFRSTVLITESLQNYLEYGYQTSILWVIYDPFKVRYPGLCSKHMFWPLFSYQVVRFFIVRLP